MEEEFNTLINSLHEKFPEIISPLEVIGKTYQNNPIHSYTIHQPKAIKN